VDELHWNEFSQNKRTSAFDGRDHSTNLP